MALISCPECGTAGVSSEAVTCNHCGYPVKEGLQRAAEAEAARLAEEEEAREKSRRESLQTTMIIIGVVAFFIILAASGVIK